jgi:pimeloyl-ACP methyl ester carboxylesterase
MIDETRLFFIHGSTGEKSRSYKARLLHKQFPGMVIPDFDGELPARMLQLEALIGGTTGWTLIGSSLGGLMAALFAVQHPQQVRRLVLLAPALTFQEFSDPLPDPVAVPTVLIHGTRDELVPAETVRSLAEKVFTNLSYFSVDDDHRLHKTAKLFDWRALFEGGR